MLFVYLPHLTDVYAPRGSPRIQSWPRRRRV